MADLDAIRDALKSVVENSIREADESSASIQFYDGPIPIKRRERFSLGYEGLSVQTEDYSVTTTINRVIVSFLLMYRNNNNMSNFIPSFILAAKKRLRNNPTLNGNVTAVFWEDVADTNVFGDAEDTQFQFDIPLLVVEEDE